MRFPGSLPRRRAAVALVLLGLAAGVLLDGRALLERAVRARLKRAAAERGFSFEAGRIAFAFPPALELRDVVVEGHGGGLVAARLVARLRVARRAADALRGVAWERAVVSLPAGDVTLDLPAGAFDVERAPGGVVRLRERDGPGQIAARSGGDLSLEATRVDLGRLVRVRLRGEEPFRGGVVTGALRLRAASGGLPFDVLGEVRGVRVASLGADEGAPRYGAPFDGAVAAAGTLHPADRRVVVDCFRLESPEAVVRAEGTFAAGEQDLLADARVEMPRVSVAGVLAASGIAPGNGGGDMGSFSLSVAGSGHLKDPASIRVEQDLDFTPPRTLPPELVALRGPFRTELDGPQGPHTVDLRPGSASFVPLEEVPPLFLRTLLISEDAGFWGHPGIDLREVPVAVATNWSRGEKARGASTISQQLAKNLFLSRRKSYGRKLQEVALTLLLESALGKRRILEIYLNVIEWGPGVYGLRDAARHYFGKEPRDLTPREGAFLVSMIPGPLKYQASIRGGEVSRRFDQLVDRLLAKLRSVDALTDEEYAAALDETLAFTFGRAAEEPPSDATDGAEAAPASP